MQLAVGNARGNAGQHAALHRHAALPHEGNLQEVLAIIIPIKKENIPQASADETREAAINADIQHVLVPATILLS